MAALRMRDDVGYRRPPLAPTFTPASCAGIGPDRGPAISSRDIISVRHGSWARYGEVFKFYLNLIVNIISLTLQFLQCAQSIT